MELFHFIFPKSDICNEEELYFRIVPSSVSSNSVTFNEKAQEIKLNKGAVISFDTYFNCFSYSKYSKYTWVDCIGISVMLKGKFTLRLISARMNNLGQSTEVLQEHLIDFSKMDQFRLAQNISCNDAEGIYYIELTALSDEAIFSGGYYFVDEANQTVNPVKVAFVICTYKREDYVYRNIRIANDYIFNSPYSNIKDNMNFFIVDNGNTIDVEKVESKHVKVLKNKNFGGSGGFTRGIIEAYKRRNEYTHVLLMDDDILFEGEVLEKTVNFLKVLKSDHTDLCIGASMLREDIPYLQHEAGAFWNGIRSESIKPNYDLRMREKLVFNECEELVNYSGWWYMCIPLSIINEGNFPLPLFIKIDDMEYGIRLCNKILHMNGIGVWHEYFDFKYSVSLQYYLKRNELILAAIHYPQFGALFGIKKLLLTLGKHILKRNYSVFDFVFRAYDDFLKGIDFLLQTDPETLNNELIQRSKEPSHDGSIIYFPIMLIKCCLQFPAMTIKLLGEYQTAAQTYQTRMKEVTSLDFWCLYLDIEKESEYSSEN